MAQRCRIAVGQISSESNHFVPSICELDFFRATGYVYAGDELFQLEGSDTEIGGMLAACQRDGNVDVLPLVAARANSSSPLSRECYAYLRRELLQRLVEAGPVDAVLLSHHGSMATETEDDPEGDIAEAVREIVGPAVPIAITLDLHGNVTRRMVEAANLILGYEHYPHDDTGQTGARAAELLLRTARGRIDPVMSHVRIPMLLTASNGSTLAEAPFAQLMQGAKRLEREPGVLSTSLFFVGSYVDIPEMGCSSLVVTDGDADSGAGHALRLAEKFWARRGEFAAERLSVAEAVERGRQIEGGPILLLETADTTGGGAAGDGIGVVKGLLAAGVTEPCLAMVVDPEAVRHCLECPDGQTADVKLGHGVDPSWGQPLAVSATVVRKLEGGFVYEGGILADTPATMGPSVVLGIGSIQVLVTTYPTYDWAYEQYAAAGLDPRRARFVGVKNMMNFRFGYQDMMKGHFVLDLPGPTPADMRALPFKRVVRPIYPLDEDLRNPEMRVARSPALPRNRPG